MANSDAFVIGVDGGGTGTRVRIASLSGQTHITLEGASSAVSANGLLGSMRVLENLIASALKQSGCDATDLRAMCLGLSGADRPDEREPLLRWAHDRFTPNIALVNDCEIALEAGTPDDWGIALIAGTGSIAFGKSRDGTRARAGGWGYLIGDEGSGYAIGRDALRAAVHHADGRGKQTQLLDMILAHWQLQQPVDLVSKVYRHNDGATPIRPAQMAALAPLVLAAADGGDVIAQSIMHQAANDLAETVLAVAHKLFFVAGKAVPLALAGGLILGSPSLRRQVINVLNASKIAFAPIGLAHEPVAGAVKIALRLAAGR